MDLATGQGRLILVSNRLPVEARQEVDGVRWQKSPGGLVQALGGLLGSRGLWIGCAGIPGRWDVDEGMADADISLPYRLRAVPLTKREYDQYYLGFANQIIWPLFHDLHPYCRFRSTYWNTYRSMNDRFAAAVEEEVRPQDIVWVHDYHLIGVGARLRKSGIEAPIGFFLHVPFPANDIFRRFPWHADLIRSLTAYDHVGFQTWHDARNFMRSLHDLDPSTHMAERADVWTVSANKRTFTVSAHPIGIDAREVEEKASSAEVQQRVEALGKQDVKYILGVERLDYTKGVPERLEAFRAALRRHPELRGRVSLVQHVDPSREGIARYANLRNEIEQTVGSINGEYGTLAWTPVHYSYSHLAFEDVLALYKISDVALVTPIRDGMNLVAKEYCAARSDEDGVLVLSEFTGAAQQLGDHALVVNPHDVDGTADAIHRACTMDPKERRRRMRAMRENVRQSNVQDWAQGFLDRLRKMEPIVPEVRPR